MSTRKLTLSALFIALITVGAFIRIPVGSDVFTLQFLFTLLTGLILGARLGALTVSAYVAAGLVGLPIFATGSGPAYILQPTFGYLVGFIVQAAFCGYAVSRVHISFKSVFIINLVGMAIVYLFGISYFYFASNFIIDAPISLWLAIFYCGILQAPPDILICAAAAFIYIRLNFQL